MQKRKIYLDVTCNNNFFVSLLDVLVKITLVMGMFLANYINMSNSLTPLLMIVFIFTFFLKNISQTRIYNENNHFFLKYAFCSEPPIEMNIEKNLKKQTEDYLFWNVDGETYITNIPDELRK